jgi:hypothetical protein
MLALSIKVLDKEVMLMLMLGVLIPMLDVLILKLGVRILILGELILILGELVFMLGALVLMLGVLVLILGANKEDDFAGLVALGAEFWALAALEAARRVFQVGSPFWLSIGNDAPIQPPIGNWSMRTESMVC